MNRLKSACALPALVGIAVAARRAGARRDFSVAADPPDHALRSGRHRRFRRPRSWRRSSSEVLGQTVVAENRPGAGGIVGVDFVAHSDPDGYNVVLMDPAHRHQSDAAEIDALRHFQGPGDDFDRQLVARSSGGCARSLASRPMPSSSPTAKPIPASSITPPPASAPRRILPPQCGSCAPASTPCTCPIRASAHPTPT